MTRRTVLSTLAGMLVAPWGWWRRKKEDYFAGHRILTMEEFARDFPYPPEPEEPDDSIWPMVDLTKIKPTVTIAGKYTVKTWTFPGGSCSIGTPHDPRA